MFNIGDKVIWDGRRCEVLRVYKNGGVRIVCWVQTFGAPRLMKFTVPATHLRAA